ncbi:MAG: hypothetical protein ACRD9R_13050 [Pyrinomonadaceae bacterium]
MGVFGKSKGGIHETPDVSYISNPDVLHEHTDVQVRPIAWFVFGLGVFFLLVCALMWGAFQLFERRAAADERPASPLARQGEERLPAEPRLQLAPGFGVTKADGQRVDLSNDVLAQGGRAPQPQSEYWVVRDEWQQELEHYGWADQGAGRVRIPVAEAMKLYARRQAEKASAHGGQQPQQQGGTQNETLPSPASAGRQEEKRNQ